MNRDALAYYQSFSHSVKDFCAPLEKYLGITFFCYAKFYKDNKYLYISNDPEFNDFYIKNVNFGNIFLKIILIAKPHMIVFYGLLNRKTFACRHILILITGMACSLC